MKTLGELLLEGLQAWAGIAQDSFLLFGYSNIKKVVDFIEAEPDAQYANSELRQLFKDPNWAGNSAVKERVFQLIGEAQFWMLARAKGVQLERIPEGALRSPDFRLKCSGDAALCFEVKTLSVVGGTYALDAMTEQRFEGELDMRRQIEEGSQFGWNVQAITPHGEIPEGKEQSTLCQGLLKKIENNIKEEQYTGAPTFLVVNMMLIDSYYTGNIELKPLCAGWPHAFSEHTGVLWTVGFGELDQQIKGERRYDGHENIEGTLGRQGILTNSQFSSVAGLLFIIHPMRTEPRTYGLWNSTRLIFPRFDGHFSMIRNQGVRDEWKETTDVRAGVQAADR